MENIIEKLKQSGLTGKSGSDFPTWQKWQMVKDASASRKYIICNGSEGEPMVFKDRHILEKFAPDVVAGIKIALKTIPNSEAFIYLNKDYFQKFSVPLKELIGDLPIKLWQKKGGYLAGEETSIIEAIEGNAPEPRIKPPFPTEKGLWQSPTLVNNVETLYWVAKIYQNEYAQNRFYSIEGEIKNKGVFELPLQMPIKDILKTTDNLPSFPFFIQAGGGACGEILLPEELDKPLKGNGSIIVFNKQTTNIIDLMKSWADFFSSQNCDKCAPCREGLFRLKELIYLNKFDPKTINDIFNVLEKTSLCPLGKVATIPFKTALQKLIK